MIVLDTHVWLWWVSDPDRLSTAAREAIDAAEEIAISAISAWEVAMLEARGRIALDRLAPRWIRAALDADPRIVPASLTASIAVRAARHDGLPGDPADRFVYATACERGASLVTRDEALRRHDPARTIW